MKYAILSFALLAFTNVLAALAEIPNKFMVVHNVNVVFRKSKRDIDTIGFSLYNVADGKHFTCTSTRMPYYPMTPDFVSHLKFFLFLYIFYYPVPYLHSLFFKEESVKGIF